MLIASGERKGMSGATYHGNKRRKRAGERAKRRKIRKISDGNTADGSGARDISDPQRKHRK